MQGSKFDAIVIGSGIGGLSCAASLAMCDYKVLVLEKSPSLGGSMGTFTEPETGHWTWSPGVQWVCDYSRDSVDYKLLHAITDGNISFSPLDDECQFKYFPELDYQFTFVNDKDKLLEKLKIEFPGESQKIDRYFGYLNILAKKAGMFSLPKMFSPAMAGFMFWFSKTFKMLPHMDKSVTEVLDGVLKIENKKLRAILLSFSHYFGMPLDETPFPFYAYAQNMQFTGMYYPDGGGQAIIDALVTSIGRKGGEARQASGVKQILFKDNEAIGVILEDDTHIYSNTVISSIGIKETLYRLVPEKERPAKLVKALAKHRSVPSFLLLLVGFEGDISSFNIKRSAYKTIIGDPSTMSRNPMEEGWVCDDVTISFPSLLNVKYKKPDFHTAEIHHETRYEYFEKFEGKQDCDEYRQITEQIAQHFLNRLDERFPGIKAHVRYFKLITPLDIKKLTHHEDGSMFGLDIHKADNPELSPRSGMKNLFFTGEDIFAHGLTPLNGVLTASVVTGKNLIKKFV
ncbi:MAG: NAD(P)/FAD-dependent oxidoreductase [Desulfobacterales bacterium]|nr:NAD(P)/FAD-dependent oxidoreductase [Desulfobacterales bacterium]